MQCSQSKKTAGTFRPLERGLDIHGGDGNESLGYSSYRDVKAGRPEVGEKSKQMGLAFGFDRIVMDNERPTEFDSGKAIRLTPRFRPGIAMMPFVSFYAVIPAVFSDSDKRQSRMQ